MGISMELPKTIIKGIVAKTIRSSVRLELDMSGSPFFVIYTSIVSHTQSGIINLASHFVVMPFFCYNGVRKMRE